MTKAKTPTCPECGNPPLYLMDNGRQAFCGTLSCTVVQWNPTMSVAELNANKSVVDLESP